MILVVGDVMNDVIVRPSGPLQPGTDCPAEIRQVGGGSGANLACWLGRLGAPVRFAGRVGADHAAQVAALAAHGVDARLGRDASRPTGTVVAVIGAGGERSFYTDRGANLALGPDDLPLGLLDGVRLLHVSGYALFEAGPRGAARGLMAGARARDVAVSVDAGSSAFLRAAGPEAFRGWTTGANLCFANAEEAAVLAANDADYGCRVVTAGAAGASAWLRGEQVSVPGEAVAARDATGAGDAFAAGFLSAWSRGDDLMACLSRGALCGAIAVGLAGARPTDDIGLY